MNTKINTIAEQKENISIAIAKAYGINPDRLRILKDVVAGEVTYFESVVLLIDDKERLFDLLAQNEINIVHWETSVEAQGNSVNFTIQEYLVVHDSNRINATQWLAGRALLENKGIKFS